MAFRCLAAASFAAACSGGDSPPSDAAIAADADPATTYHGVLDHTEPLAFGGQGFCDYRMTLKDLVVDVAITASGRVPSAHVQDLNFEELITMPCGEPPASPIGPNTATYDLELATPSTTGIGLTFTAATTNHPPATLAANLTRSATGYTAALVFHRFGEATVLNWTIYVSVELAPAPQQ
jgi:hypothetical protein